jgi:DUF971 family protein
VFCPFFLCLGLPALGQGLVDFRRQELLTLSVRPKDIQQIGSELAVKWDDGTESFFSLEALRRACPCAGCKGEMDVMGNLYRGPEKPLTPSSFQLVGIGKVGGYAIQPQWGDGHSTGLYSFDYLRQLVPSSGS